MGIDLGPPDTFRLSNRPRESLPSNKSRSMDPAGAIVLDFQQWDIAWSGSRAIVLSEPLSSQLNNASRLVVSTHPMQCCHLVARQFLFTRWFRVAVG